MRIPVLGVPVLNRPDLLGKLIASLDVAVGRLVIIDNSATGLDFGPLPESAVVVGLRHNLGVAASWNLIVKMTPAAEWWCIVNNDIEFAPGDLARLAWQVESEPSSFAQLGGSMSAFGLTRIVHERLGFFDENFHPAYYEDNDFIRRCVLTGTPTVTVEAAYRHVGSATIHSDPALMEQNHTTFPQNGDYYLRKWGGFPAHEKFDTPFDAGGDIRDWRPSIDRLSHLAWRVK